MTEVTADNLHDVMEFDHVIRVAEDGTVTSNLNESAYFDLSMYIGDDGQWHDSLELPEGWQLMNGYSGQQGYAGPIMHQSESIGGRMARDILETPGLYVALVVGADCDYTEDHCTEEQGCDCQPAGWAVAFKPAAAIPMVTDSYHYGDKRYTETVPLDKLRSRLEKEAEFATDEATRAGRRANVAAALAELEATGRSESWGWHTFTLEAGE